MGTRGYNMEYAPESKKWTVTPLFVAATDANDSSAQEYLTSGGMSSSLEVAKPYRRQIDLEGLEGLRKPGLYNNAWF
jgi:hypothetical protein